MAQFVIRGVRVFDGETAVDGTRDVLVRGGTIAEIRDAVDGDAVDGDAVDGDAVDGRGSTLLPGLIDAHVHADEDGLAQAALFGVTTVLDMGSSPPVIDPLRAECARRHDLSDIYSAVTGLTRPDGHPHQLIGDLGDPGIPTARTVEQVPAFVDDRVAEGADYLKTWLEDGSMLGASLPPLDPDILEAFVRAGHARGLRVLVHALTRDTAEQAIAAGADGLTHLFADRPHTEDLVARTVDAGCHVVPTLVLVASLCGDSSSAELADDPRVRELAGPRSCENLSRTVGTVGPDGLENCLASAAALHAAGVPVLAGTDAAGERVAGVAPGVSLHGELRLLVRAGLTPSEALRAATSSTAARFDLTDRGRVAVGARADLVLVDGDPTTRIEDTLSIRAVWRGGTAVRRTEAPHAADGRAAGR